MFYSPQAIVRICVEVRSPIFTTAECTLAKHLLCSLFHFHYQAESFHGKDITLKLCDKFKEAIN
ncbi:hypothetical protein IQ244_23625 [Nostoc sp. LEGE 06077]|uniref:hypothetical protein n=1 Tax=Nostoc sp. LEGE 06077 TaxID=915325 RepID=UPI0018801E04|nr:hypothetical protein [Nostoc sp. LEGE 06077]MBE9209434.1 hypothetical protein [Nostoc sp. LEGE 06077]